MRQKYSLITAALISLMVSPLGAWAGKVLPMSEQGKSHTKAPDSSKIMERTDDDVIVNPPGLEKRVFIHYKKGSGKSGNGKADACYTLLGEGVKWRTLPVDFVVNPSPFEDEGSVVNAMATGAEKWDNETRTKLFGSYSVDYSADWDDTPTTRDGVNEMSFEELPNANTIAITVTWGYFSGSRHSREIIEFDILYNLQYQWGDAEMDPTVMDIENIAVHEIGHGLGLGDLYNGTCAQETMYGYSSNGETEKRSLNGGDLRGIQKLYGK